MKTAGYQPDILAGNPDNKYAVLRLKTADIMIPENERTPYQCSGFGANGVELVLGSPFRLCQVPGFDFKRVDTILQKSSSDLHNPMRAQKALFYALEKSRNEGGHLYMEIFSLIRFAL